MGKRESVGSDRSGTLPLMQRPHSASLGPGDGIAAASRVLVGTSGYNYTEWKGSFYPDTLSSKKMLSFYAARPPTVEINYTLYRMPTERLLAGWSEVTPDHFRFTLKAPRRITHDARLRRCEESTAAFCGAAQTLGAKLGMLLFQLPPSFKKDLAVLDDFLAVLPPADPTLLRADSRSRRSAAPPSSHRTPVSPRHRTRSALRVGSPGA